MNLYKIFIVAVVSLFVFGSCQKQNIVHYDFSEITVTDNSCLYISEIDSTDWSYDHNLWTNAEMNLMNFTDTINTSDTVNGFIQVSAACPNPNEGAFLMSVATEKSYKLKTVCVNQSLQVLYYNSRKLTGGPIYLGFDFRSVSSFHKNENYRLYYGFYNAKDSLCYKGHGDFRIE